MDRKSTEHFKNTLQKRHIELSRRVSLAQDERRDLEPNAAKDDGDRAVSSQTREMLFRLKSESAGLLAEIKNALNRIQAGNFGLCLNCEQEISANRLKAIPWVRYCITCQELLEDQR